MFFLFLHVLHSVPHNGKWQWNFIQFCKQKQHEMSDAFYPFLNNKNLILIRCLLLLFIAAMLLHLGKLNWLDMIWKGTNLCKPQNKIFPKCQTPKDCLKNCKGQNSVWWNDKWTGLYPTNPAQQNPSTPHHLPNMIQTLKNGGGCVILVVVGGS